MRHPGDQVTAEPLEQRHILAAPAIDAIADVTLASSRSVTLLLSSTATDSDRLTYRVRTSTPQLAAKLHRKTNPFVRLRVSGFGAMTFQLLRDVAPRTVDRFAGLVRSGFYDGLSFHRVADLLGGGRGWVAQGGDPAGDGSGGPGHPSPSDWYAFDDEYRADAIFSGSGQLALANSGDDTNGSQFLITAGAVRHLDFDHTVFGQFMRGQTLCRNCRCAAACESRFPPVFREPSSFRNVVLPVVSARADVRASLYSQGGPCSVTFRSIRRRALALPSALLPR